MNLRTWLARRGGKTGHKKEARGRSQDGGLSQESRTVAERLGAACSQDWSARDRSCKNPLLPSYQSQ